MQIEVRKADMGKEKKRLKVCAYARVSTEASEQENSLENQVSHYTEMIQSNPAYEFAGVYADFGISGFKESRPQFQKMMQDAKNGKIDLIVNTPIGKDRNVDDSYLCKAAIKKKVPYMTTMAAAKATISGIQSLKKPGCGEVRSLQELHSEIKDK